MNEYVAQWTGMPPWKKRNMGVSHMDPFFTPQIVELCHLWRKVLHEGLDSDSLL